MLLGLLLSGATVTEPQAAPRVCRQLEADLAAASRGGGGGPAMIRKYDAAIARQREQISKARGQSSSAGCGFSLFGRNINQCAGLNATIERMNANLDALQSKRERLADGGGSRRDRGRILAALDANGCRDDDNTIAPRGAPLQEANREDGNANLFDQLFGGNSRQIDSLDTLDQPDDPGEERNVRRVLNQPGITDFPSAGGEFHTSLRAHLRRLFLSDVERRLAPAISNATRRIANRAAPAPRCRSSIRAAWTTISASMTSSVTGRPYSELPTAYLYKQSNMSRPPACGCNAAQNFQIIGGNPPYQQQSQPETDAAPLVPVPVSKPDPGADPETLATLKADSTAKRSSGFPSSR